MTNTELLEEKIKASGLKKNYIAEMLNITPYALSKKIRNENEFKVSEVEKMCELLGIYDFEEERTIFFAK